MRKKKTKVRNYEQVAHLGTLSSLNSLYKHTERLKYELWVGRREERKKWEYEEHKKFESTGKKGKVLNKIEREKEIGNELRRKYEKKEIKGRKQNTSNYNKQK